MKNTKVLLMGVLGLVAGTVILAGIVILAPYIIGAALAILIGWSAVTAAISQIRHGPPPPTEKKMEVRVYDFNNDDHL